MARVKVRRRLIHASGSVGVGGPLIPCDYESTESGL